MKYTIKGDLHSNKSVFEQNKLSHRAYFIPFDTAAEANKATVTNARYTSPRIKMLNSDWVMRYYKSFSDIASNFDSDDTAFVPISVPSTWQRTGFEQPWYLNTRYQFKMRPPVIDYNVPAAIYRNRFVIDNLDGRRIITFLGVCSSCALYLNGEYVGYAEGSHNMNEFDISKYLTIGDNEILAVVTKFSNGSYLECQDMFRENGIFRDVYITNYADTDIYDYQLTPIKNEDGTYNLNVESVVTNADDKTELKIELYDADNKIIKAQSANKAANFKMQLDNLQVQEWSAEIPNLYKAMITLSVGGKAVSVVRQAVGFKTVAIDGEVFLHNGKPIKLLGINHHDTDAANGWVMTAEQLERDVKVMKEYNCNCVRMSHYPPDPILLDLCDIYGLYAVDEADIECHNVYSNPLDQRFGRISNNLYWRDQFVDRVDNMYMRDRNHASIVMWSLGNEAGGHLCHDEAYHHLKSKTSIPIHYEGVIHTKRHSYDVISQMYPHTPRVEAIGKHLMGDKFKGKPFFLCEYAHAMGVGPGALDVYVDLFYEYDNIMGGCVWEFADHAVLNEKGKFKYTYGGDHNEPKHDGNFCVDGMFHPDRTPSSGALTMKAAYRPIRAEHIEGSIYSFKNHRFFKNSDDIVINWELRRNGKAIANGKLVNTDIAPQCNKDYDLAHSKIDKNSDYNMVFTYEYESAEGAEIGIEQIILNEAVYNADLTVGKKLNVVANKKLYTIKYDNGSVIFDAHTGELLSYTIHGTELINQAPSNGVKGLTPGINRPLIDNDRFITILWSILGYDKAAAEYRRAKVTEGNGAITIKTRYNIKWLGNLAKSVITYTVTANGSITVDVCIKRGWKLLAYSDIPRAGVAMELGNEFDNVEYYAMGEHENLSDMREHATLGIYKSRVIDMEDFYIKPQDSGNRTGARYVKLTRKDGRGLAIYHRGNYFDFRVKKYAINDIIKAKHIEDVPIRETTCIYIDGAYRGAGSQSCGQQPLTGHKPNLKKPIKFSFVMKPIIGE